MDSLTLFCKLSRRPKEKNVNISSNYYPICANSITVSFTCWNKESLILFSIFFMGARSHSNQPQNILPLRLVSINA